VADCAIYQICFDDQFKEGLLSTNQLVVKSGWRKRSATDRERPTIFLLRLRTDLHYATGRATDLLHINLQEQIAKRLNYSLEWTSPQRGAHAGLYEHGAKYLSSDERITEQFVSGYVTNQTRTLFSFLPYPSRQNLIGDSFLCEQTTARSNGAMFFAKSPSR